MINVDTAELARFAAVAQRWWDPQGEMRPLHDLNPVRLAYVEQATPLDGRTVVDVGCGGGLLSEAMALRGATVTGLDLSPELLEVAKRHARESGVAIDYRLAAAEQERHYARAQWYLSLPESDSVAVSVLEAMGHGCIPLLSDLPANRELVEPGRNGLIVRDAEVPALPQLEALLAGASAIAKDNRAWVQQHGLFAPAIARLLARLREAA